MNLIYYAEWNVSRVFLLIKLNKKTQETTTVVEQTAKQIDLLQVHRPTAEVDLKRACDGDQPFKSFYYLNYVYLIKWPLARWCNSRSTMKLFNHV